MRMVEFTPEFWKVIDVKILDLLQKETQNKAKDHEYLIMDISYITDSLSKFRKGSPELWKALRLKVDDILQQNTKLLSLKNEDHAKLFEDTLYIIRGFMKVHQKVDPLMDRLFAYLDS